MAPVQAVLADGPLDLAVKLGGESAPGCYHAWYRAVQAESAAEGAVFGADGGLVLPPVLVEELRANARARGWVARR